MDYNFLSVEDFLRLEESGTLLEIGTYEGKDAETGGATLRRRAFMQRPGGRLDCEASGQSTSAPLTLIRIVLCKSHPDPNLCVSV